MNFEPPPASPGDDAGMCGGALRSSGWLLWKAACLRGAPSALAARLPPELRFSASPGSPDSSAIHRVLAPFEPIRAFMTEKPQKSDASDYSKTLFLPQTEFPMRAGPAAARTGNPQALERDRP